MGSVEAEGLEVIEDKVPLGCLVEHELDDLRAIFAGPELRDFCEALDAHAAFFLLDAEVLVCRGANHELDLGVQLGL